MHDGIESSAKGESKGLLLDFWPTFSCEIPNICKDSVIPLISSAVQAVSAE